MGSTYVCKETNVRMDDCYVVCVCVFVWHVIQVALCKAIIAGSSISLIKQDLVIGTGTVCVCVLALWQPFTIS